MYIFNILIIVFKTMNNEHQRFFLDIWDLKFRRPCLCFCRCFWYACFFSFIFRCFRISSFRFSSELFLFISFSSLSCVCPLIIRYCLWKLHNHFLKIKITTLFITIFKLIKILKLRYVCSRVKNCSILSSFTFFYQRSGSKDWTWPFFCIAVLLRIG